MDDGDEVATDESVEKHETVALSCDYIDLRFERLVYERKAMPRATSLAQAALALPLARLAQPRLPLARYTS